MGLREILTKPLGGKSSAFAWREPAWFRVRLRGDGLMRLLMMSVAWIMATGVFLLLFAINVNPPAWPLALFLGAVFGLGPVGIALFGLRGQTSGRVTIDDRGIHRYRTHADLTANWAEWTDWPFEAIRSAAVVRAEDLETPFSVLLISEGEGSEILGIPAGVDLVALMKYLKSRDVTVAKSGSIPAKLRKPAVSVPVVAVSAGIGICTLIAGGLAFAGAGPRLRQPPRVAEQQEALPPPGGDELPVPVVPGPDQPPPNSKAAGELSQIIGGAGGFAFQHVSPGGQPLLGVRYTIGMWEGHESLGTLEPLFDRAAAGEAQTVLAPEGYAVGGIDVDAPEFVDAIRLIYLRSRPDGTLDPQDTARSAWLGRPSGQSERTIQATGARAIGLHGRGGAVLDAVGLVFEKR